MPRFITAVVVTAVLVVAAAVAWDRFAHQATRLLPDECVAAVGDLRARIDPEQARNAALISAIAVRRGLPARAATIALATAFQESKMYNIDYGDRDSLGLFQQRPSQGWGSVAQVQDPTYAANKFYDGLVKVKGYQSMEITVAAQKVQRSGFPRAYAQHEERARALASALTGQSPGTFSCRFGQIKAGSATRVKSRMMTTFGSRAGTPVVTGRSVSLDIVELDTGWALAHWSAAYAQRLGISSIRFDGSIWTGAEGWTPSAGVSDRQLVVTVKASDG